MAAESICDGCGKRQEMIPVRGNWIKPYDWFERSDQAGIQTACSRDCIDVIDEKNGKTRVILPI